MQPAGKYLSERFHRAGGVPAVLAQLIAAGAIDGRVMNGDRQDPGRECRRLRNLRSGRHLSL
jgi:dihydroxyacid dehydratase/phosphogluconate dehydratase